MNFLPAIPGSSDQVIVLLSALAACGFWAGCKLHDILRAQRTAARQVAATPHRRGSSHPSTRLGAWDR